MRPPSLNLRMRFVTFHSISVGGRLAGLLKKISYSIFSRRSWWSRRFSSSSMVTGRPAHRIARNGRRGEVPQGHAGHGTKVPVERHLALSTWQLATADGARPVSTYELFRGAGGHFPDHG